MKLWQIALFVFLAIGVIIYYETKDVAPQPTPIFIPSDTKPLENEASDLHKSADISQNEASQVIKNTKPLIKKYHDKDKAIITLSADSSLRLFTEWNEQIDSIGEGYFFLGSNPLYNQLQ